MLETRKEFEEKLPERIEQVKKKVHKGDIICYRVNLVEVLSRYGEKLWIRGPYGEEQHIDWEDVVEYNRDLWE